MCLTGLLAHGNDSFGRMCLPLNTFVFPNLCFLPSSTHDPLLFFNTCIVIFFLQDENLVSHQSTRKET